MGLHRQSLEFTRATFLCPGPPGVLMFCWGWGAMEGHDRTVFQGDQLVPTWGSRASLREDAETLGREDCFVNCTALSPWKW